MFSRVRAIAVLLLILSGCADAELDAYLAGEGIDNVDGVNPATDDDLDNWLEDELPDGSDGSLSAISCDQRWFPPLHTAETAARQTVPYDRVGSTCSGGATEGATALGHFIRNNFGDLMNLGVPGDGIQIYNCRQVRGGSRMSVHAEGRAVDVFISTVGGVADNSRGDTVANWLIENAEYIGVQLVIWDRTIWQASRSPQARCYLGSNAHVFADDPLSQSSTETRILQPGRADGGTAPGDVVGTYHWHQPLAGSGCTLSNAIAGLLNGASDLLGRRTRFRLTVTDRAKIDFAVAEPTVDYELKMATAHEWDGFVGLGFAGSTQASFFCKAEHIEVAGWKPVEKTIQVVSIGETIHKVGRTSEYTSGQVLDDSAYGRVSYGGLSLVEFDDVILTTPMLEGGDSGDSAWKIMTMDAD